uniref:Hydrophobic surface binding protein n=1 Tax=Mycena chlorophos TaxID=658473 RepID=A0ABQ0L457_MYCCL|nr:predicted protein [Mycena chlorophos]
MVHLTRSFAVLSAVLGLALASPVDKRTVASVEADLNKIAAEVTTLLAEVQAFPSSGLLGALEIEEAAAPIITALAAAASDSAATGPLSESDGAAVLAIVNGFEPAIIEVANLIAGDAAAFEADLPGLDAVVLNDLEQIYSGTQNLATQLIDNAPADLQPTATVINDAILAALSSAIEVYETAT